MPALLPDSVSSEVLSGSRLFLKSVAIVRIDGDEVKGQHSLTGRFQLLFAVPLSELRQADTSLVALFSDSTGGQEVSHDLLGGLADTFRSHLEFVIIVIQVFPMSVRHMLRLHNWLNTEL